MAQRLRLLPLVVEWASARREPEFHYSEAVEHVRRKTGRDDPNLDKIVLRGISRSKGFSRVGPGRYRLFRS